MRFLPLISSLLITSACAIELHVQRPIMANPHAGLGPAIPAPENPSSQPTTGDVILTDVLGRDRSINIFAGFTRDIDSISSRLADSTLNSTILAPVNSAITALPRKPWEDPQDYSILGENAYEGEDGQQRAQKNLKRFVEAHVVPISPWAEGEKVECIAGGNVWWEKKEGKTFIQPGNIEVLSIGSKVANGEVWILKETRNYA